MRTVLATALLLFFGSAVGASADSALRPAGSVFYNGQIWTGNEEQPWATGMAIRDGRIVAIGSSEDAGQWLGPGARFHDLGGRFVTPGFQDSHIHMMYLASSPVDLVGAETLEEIQQRIQDYALANPSAPWIVGFGWGYSAFPDRQPLAEHLDAVVSDRPVFIRARDGHMALANTRALRLAGIAASTADPLNGRIVRLSDGLPAGELQESAMSLVASRIPKPSHEDRYQALLHTIRRASSEGLTAIHEAGVSREDIGLFLRAEEEGKLLQRVELAQRMVTPDDRNRVPVRAVEAHLEEAQSIRTKLDGPLVRSRSIKGMLDGTIDAKTAAMFENYVGTGTAGIPFWEQDVLNAVVAMYDEAGFQVILHAIGDRAISEAVGSFEYAAEVNGKVGRRHRVEHAEMPRTLDLTRFRKAGVVASTQAMFAYPDATVLQNFAVLLGEERARYADSFAMWDEAGVRQVFGSDYPVMTLSVLSGIETAVTRMTESGMPPGGWYPDGRISVEAALRHYTSDSAWATHDDTDRGSLEVGKFADFVVLSDNLFEIEPTKISEVTVLRTVLNGETVFALSPEGDN